MSYSLNSPLALAPAAPGWEVHLDTPDGATRCPVVAWASVVDDFDEDGAARTETQPVFVHDGAVMTAGEYRATYDLYAVLMVVAA